MTHNITTHIASPADEPKPKFKATRNYTTDPLDAYATPAEIDALLTVMRSDHARTRDKEVFYNKYTDYFNCYAYASGGVGSPYALQGYDKPFKTYATPGAKAGNTMRLITPEELERAVIAGSDKRQNQTASRRLHRRQTPRPLPPLERQVVVTLYRVIQLFVA